MYSSLCKFNGDGDANRLNRKLLYAAPFTSSRSHLTLAHPPESETGERMYPLARKVFKSARVLADLQKNKGPKCPGGGVTPRNFWLG